MEGFFVLHPCKTHFGTTNIFLPNLKLNVIITCCDKICQPQIHYFFKKTEFYEWFDEKKHFQDVIKINFLLKPRSLKWSWLIMDTCNFYHPICWFGKVNSHNDEPERFHKNKPLLVNHFQYLEPEPWFHYFSSAWSSYLRRGTDLFFERIPVDTIAVVQGCSHQDMNIPVSGLNMHWQTGWVPGKSKIWKNWRLKKNEG